MLRAIIAFFLLVALGAVGAPQAATKTESFDRDPGWEAFNNRVTPRSHPTVVQDFGYSPTHFAGREPGEMGGRITRAPAPAWYGDKIGPRTLDDPLHASGTFALTQSEAGAGVFFGGRALEKGGRGR